MLIERGLTTTRGAGLALIVYLFWPWIQPPGVVCGPRMEAEASTTVIPIHTVPVTAAAPPIGGRPVAEAVAEVGRIGFEGQWQDERSDTATRDHRGGQYFLAGLPTVTPAVTAPTSVPVPPVVGQLRANAIAALGRAGFTSR